MYCKRLRTLNYCQFEDRVFNFTPGMNVVVGPNGSGKSNVVKAIRSALTNLYDWNPGVKADNINNRSDPKSKSGLYLDLDYNGSGVSVVRGLRAEVGHELRQDGRAKIEGEAPVNSRVLSVLGVDTDILNNHVFIDQGKMYDFIDKTKSKRLESFNRLFGLEAAAKAHKALGDVISKVFIDGDHTERFEKAKALEEARQALEDTEASISAFDKQLSAIDAVAVDRELQSLSKQLTAHENLQQVSAKLDRVSAELVGKSDYLAGIEVTLETLERRFLEVSSKKVEADEALAAWKAVPANYSDLPNMEEELRDVEIQIAAHTRSSPGKPASYVPLTRRDTARTQLSEKVATRNRQRAILDRFEKDGVSECSQCGTVVEHMDHLDAYKRSLPELDREIQDLQAAITVSDKFESDIRVHKQKQETLETKKLRLGGEIDLLKKVILPKLSKEAASAVSVEYAQVEAARRLQLRQRDTLVAVVAQLAEQSEELTAEESSLEASVAGASSAAISHQMTTLRTQLATHNEVSRLRAERFGALEQLRTLVRDREAAWKKAEDQARERQVKRSAVEYAERVRNLLHADNTPREATLRHLRQLKAQTNEFLRCLGTPFELDVSEDVSLVAHFPDSPPMPAGRLSGGQKVAVAWAFRLAVNLRFADSVGFLCLDEPTVFLDELTIRNLEGMVGRLKELAKSRNLQIILVTHERSIAHLFDNVIDLR